MVKLGVRLGFGTSLKAWFQGKTQGKFLVLRAVIFGWSGLGTAAWLWCAVTLGIWQRGLPLLEGRAAAQQVRAATLSAILARMVFLAWGFKP